MAFVVKEQKLKKLELILRKIQTSRLLDSQSEIRSFFLLFAFEKPEKIWFELIGLLLKNV
jgi:hypothetical protein